MLIGATMVLIAGGQVCSDAWRGRDKAYQPLASVAVIMVEGHAENKGCAGGIVYSGRFIVSVRSPGIKRETDLNALLDAETLSFPEHSYWHIWPIVFGDFNRDGQPDLSVAPHFCGNNGRYWLLTIAPDGRVSVLRVIPDGSVWISDAAPSSSGIKVTEEGIRVGAYDDSKGSGVFRDYRWRPDQHAFVLLSPTPEAGK